MNKIDFCPFCGNAESDDGIDLATSYNDVIEMYSATISCGHCGASGGFWAEETLEEVKERAIDDWNNAGRPGWWDRNVSRRFSQLRYDIESFIWKIRNNDWKQIMYYRFKCGTFMEADTFEEAKQKFIEEIQEETEVERGWHRCTCLGLSHRHNCPEMKGIIPF